MLKSNSRMTWNSQKRKIRKFPFYENCYGVSTWPCFYEPDFFDLASMMAKRPRGKRSSDKIYCWNVAEPSDFIKQLIKKRIAENFHQIFIFRNFQNFRTWNNWNSKLLNCGSRYIDIPCLLSEHEIEFPRPGKKKNSKQNSKYWNLHEKVPHTLNYVTEP